MVPGGNGSLPAPRLLLGAVGLLAVAAGVALPLALADRGGASPPLPTANVSAPDAPADWAEPPDLGRLGTRLAVGTAAVLALCAATLWFGKRWTNGQPAKGGAGQLRVLATLPVGGRGVVYLVQAGNSQVVVGVDRTGVKELIPLPEPVEL